MVPMDAGLCISTGANRHRAALRRTLLRQGVLMSTGC